MRAFVVLGLVFSYQARWAWEHLRNDLFCVEWDVKTTTQSIKMKHICCIWDSRRNFQM